MPAIVADTHAVIWYLRQSKRLSKNAHAAFDQAASQTEAQVHDLPTTIGGSRAKQIDRLTGIRAQSRRWQTARNERLSHDKNLP